jgi:hypothetical protein
MACALLAAEEFGRAGRRQEAERELAAVVSEANDANAVLISDSLPE